MTLAEIAKNPIVSTAALAETMQHNDKVFSYISDCLRKFYSGDYGVTPAEDIAANNAELAAGTGRAIGHYRALPKMEDDIFIIAVFDASTPGEDSNNTCVMYCSEY